MHNTILLYKHVHNEVLLYKHVYNDKGKYSELYKHVYNDKGKYSEYSELYKHVYNELCIDFVGHAITLVTVPSSYDMLGWI